LPGFIPDHSAPLPSLPVQCQPESDSVNPGPELFRFPQSMKLLISAQKSFLGNIFGISGVSQNAVSDLKNAPLIFANANAKPGLGFFGRFGNRNSHARACHVISDPDISPDTADLLGRSHWLRAAWPPVPGRVYPSFLKQKYGCKSRQDWLQLRRNLHCL
jgi:hypothetical protein